MKVLLLITLFIFSSCSTYQTSVNSKRDAVVVQNVSVLGFNWSNLYVCKIKNQALVQCKKDANDLFIVGNYGDDHE